MKTIRKNYVKPAITVIGVEPQQMICMSGDNLLYNCDKANEIDPNTGEFD